MTGNVAVDPAVIIEPERGNPLPFADVTALLKIESASSDGRFAAAAFPVIPPRRLVAPLHRHHREDEYTIVLEGRLGLQLGDGVVEAGPGTWIVKPRGQWHTFWNAGDLPCRTIEIVSPAGFERYFREIAESGADVETVRRLNTRYHIDMDFDSVAALCKQFGLNFPGP